MPWDERQRAYRLQHGADALIERIGALDLPWVFDETNRPSLVE
jgi:hypothetical protein